MVPAYTLPPNAQNVKIMRALVKETLSHAQASSSPTTSRTPARRSTQKGGLHRVERASE